MDEFKIIVEEKIKFKVDCPNLNEEFSQQFQPPLDDLDLKSPERVIERLNTYVRKIRNYPDLVVFIYPSEIRNTSSKCFLKKLLIEKRNAKGEEENAKCQTLLDHPLIVGMVRRKWRRSGFPFHLLNLIFYTIFLSLYTACVVSNTSTHFVSNVYNTALSNDTKNPNNTFFQNVENDTMRCNDNGNSNATDHCNDIVNSGDTETCPDDDTTHLVVYLKNAVILFAVLHLVKEVIQVWMYKKSYAKLIHVENLWEIFIYIASIMFVANTSQCDDTGYREIWQWYVGIISIFFAWINVLFCLKKFDVPFVSGIPTRLFVSITKKFMMNIFLVLTIFVIAFGIVFHCILRTFPGFETVGLSITKTLAMMIGELDYSGIFIEESPKFFALGLIFYITFMYLMAIVMMNIMIGMAVEDVQEIQRTAVAQDTDLKIEYILFMEPKAVFMLKKIACCCCRNINAERKVQGAEYEIINLKDKTSTKGLNVRNIKGILQIWDEKTEEQARYDGIITRFEELKTQIELNKNKMNEELNKINKSIEDLCQKLSDRGSAKRRALVDNQREERIGSNIQDLKDSVDSLVAKADGIQKAIDDKKCSVM